MIAKWSHSLYYLEWTRKSRSQLFFDSKTSDATHRTSLQEDKVSNHEFIWSPSSISIALLTTLGRLEPSTDYLDSLSGVPDVIRPKSDVILMLGPTKR